MKNLLFPTTVIDGFLDNPDILREYGLAQNFSIDPAGTWPGKRSASLFNLSRDLFVEYNNKILSIFYKNDSNYDYQGESYFQLVDKSYNKGWVHRDHNALTAILYLTPGTSSGTSIYEKNNVIFNENTYMDNKAESYQATNRNILDKDIDSYNNNFTETINVKGLYNRLIIFDGIVHHGAHNFFGDDKVDSRLTLVSFIKYFNIPSDYPPVVRSKISIGLLQL